jgi:hypothetical protein
VLINTEYKVLMVLFILINAFTISIHGVHQSSPVLHDIFISFFLVGWGEGGGDNTDKVSGGRGG